MWAAWTSSASAASAAASPSPATAASVPPPSSLAPSSASASSHTATFEFRQWRPLATLARRIARHVSRWPPQLRVAASAAAVLACCVAGSLGVRRLVCRGSGGAVRRGSSAFLPPRSAAGGPTCGDDTAVSRDGDDISFTDPAESAFVGYLHRIKRQKEAPLLNTLDQLEDAAAALTALRRPRGDGAADEVVDEGAVAEAQARVYRLAAAADELLTQWICCLDGIPVRHSEALKQRRKALVHEAAALTRRILPHLPPRTQ
ncbi:hypothetical protein NESM_000061200 [Novymonas esmeraldas]|uniref:BAG domain-containing protein n=1 Tax=Novymonas esmeraldas TaxID=1808958 RepID=A0AAW0F4I6_9TRYP